MSFLIYAKVFFCIHPTPSLKDGHPEKVQERYNAHPYNAHVRTTVKHLNPFIVILRNS